jgi:hypothetical protein
MMMARRSHSLRRRYGHAGKLDRKSGNIAIAITYDKGHDEYRGDLSWPEISREGHVSPSIKHHLIKRIPAAAVLVKFSDVRSPRAPAVVDEAARMLIQASGLAESLGPIGPVYAPGGIKVTR